MQSIRESTLKWGLVFVVFFTPLVWFQSAIFPHMVSKTYFFIGAVSALSFVWIYSVYKDSSYCLTKEQWKWLSPFIAYIAWMCVTTITAVNSSLAFWSSFQRGTGLLVWVHVFALSVMITSLVRKYREDKYHLLLLKSVVYAGGLVAISVWGSNQGFDWSLKVFQESKGGGFLGNSSLAGAYLLIVFFVSLILLLQTGFSKKQKWGIAACSALILFSPLFINLHDFMNGLSILGNARGAFLGILVGITISVLAYIALSPKKTIRIIGMTGFLSSFVVAVVLWIRLLTPGTGLHEGFIRVASGTRLLFWHIATEALHERPIVGYGPENFSIAFQNYFDPIVLLPEYGIEAWTDRPHNVLYEIGSTMGYPGLILYIGLFISFLMAAYTAHIKSYFSRIQTSLIIGMVVGYVFQNLFVFDSTTSLMMFGALTGIMYGIQGTHIKKNVSLRANNIVISTFLAACAVVCVYYFSYLPLKKAEMMGSVLSMGVNVRYKHYMELTKGSPVGNDWDVSGVAHDIFGLYGKNSLSVKEDKNLLEYGQKDVLGMIEYAQTIAQTNTTDYRLYLSIVHLYSTYIYLSNTQYNEGLATKIESYLNQAKKLSPTDPQVEWSRAQLAAWKGDLPGVISAYEAGITIKPTLRVSHVLLLNFLKNIGRQDLYKTALVEAQKDIPGFR